MDFREIAAAETAALVERLTKAAAETAELAARRIADEAHKAADEARKTQDGLRAELQTHVDARASLQTEFETAASDRALAEDAASVAQSQAQAAEAKLAAVTDLLKASASRVKQLERLQRDNERVIRELQSGRGGTTRVGDVRASVSALEDLLLAFHALADTKTISDVLAVMVEHLAAEFSRVALFRVKSHHLQGERQIGFDLKTEIGKVMVPLGMDSLLTKAAGSGSIERLSAEELTDSSRVPFSGTPACAIALPVVVEGETIAVVYADDSGAPAAKEAAPLRVHFADVLVQYSVSLLTRMKDELHTLAELRVYADSLLREIETMYMADAGAGKAGADLTERLKMNLDYARSMFANRVTLEDVDAGGVLDDAIRAVVDAAPVTPFVRDLAGLSGHAPQRAAAEAS